MRTKLLALIIILSTAITALCNELDQPSEQGLPGSMPLNHNTVNKPSPVKPITNADGIFNLNKTLVPDYIHKKNYGILEGIIYPQAQQYSGKLPISRDTMYSARTGIFLTQPPIGYILYKSKPDAQLFDRLLLDTNLNDTLSDEKPIIIQDITRKTPVALNFSDKPDSFDLVFTQKGLKLYPKYWREGNITLNGKVHKAAIFKSTYGTDYDYGVVLLVDLNNDGKFTTSRYELLTEAFLLRKQMVLQGRFYTAAISKDGYKLDFQKLNGDYGQIAFILPDTAKPLAKSVKFSFLPEGGSGRDILKIALNDFPITLPAGRYGIIEGLVYDKDFRELLKFACPTFGILKDKRLKLKLNSARMEALARQDNDKLIAAQKTYGPKDIYFNLVGPATADDPGPELLVYNTENPDEIYFKDHLEYG